MRQANSVVVGLMIASMAVSAAAQKQDARASAEAAGKTFSEAVMAGDAAKLASLYTEDAQAFPPNAARVDGRAAIQKMWADVLASGVKKMDIKTGDVQESDGYAYETGTYSISGEADKHIDHGKYVVVWKQVQGKWMMHRDIWNSDMAAPAGH